MNDPRKDLKGMTIPELEAFFRSRGKERYRARQVSRWIYRKYAEGFAAMTDLSRGFREELEAECRISNPPLERSEVSTDGSEKLLFLLEDRERVECVLIPEEDRRTVCLSTQAGCRLACAFCATGSGGGRRSLTSAEIIHQACVAARKLEERGDRLTNVVFMGMGEPLENVPELSRTIDILLSPLGFGLAGKRVTVSTAGIVPAMREIAARYPVSLAVSLNAANDDLRSRLMPVNRKYPLREVVRAMREIPLRSGRRVTAEYVLLDAVNDSPGDARALSALLSGMRTKVNLIPYNPHEGARFRTPPATSIDRFRGILMEAGIQTITREKRGVDIRAACGQLRGACAGERKPLEPPDGSSYIEKMRRPIGRGRE